MTIQSYFPVFLVFLPEFSFIFPFQKWWNEVQDTWAMWAIWTSTDQIFPILGKKNHWVLIWKLYKGELWLKKGRNPYYYTLHLFN